MHSLFPPIHSPWARGLLESGAFVHVCKEPFFLGQRGKEAREASPLWTHRNQAPSYSFTDLTRLKVCIVYFRVFQIPLLRYKSCGFKNWIFSGYFLRTRFFHRILIRNRTSGYFFRAAAFTKLFMYFVL